MLASPTSCDAAAGGQTAAATTRSPTSAAASDNRAVAERESSAKSLSSVNEVYAEGAPVIKAPEHVRYLTP